MLFPTFYWPTSVADWRYSGGFRQNITSPDPGMPLGREGITDPCSTKCIFTSVSSVLQAIARCPPGMYGKLHKHYVRHVSLGNGGLQSCGSFASMYCSYSSAAHSVLQKCPGPPVEERLCVCECRDIMGKCSFIRQYGCDK